MPSLNSEEPATGSSSTDVVSFLFVKRFPHTGASDDGRGEDDDPSLIRAEVAQSEFEPNTYHKLVRTSDEAALYVMTNGKLQWSGTSPRDDNVQHVVSFHFQPHLIEVDQDHVSCVYYISCLLQNGNRLYFSYDEDEKEEDKWTTTTEAPSYFLVYHLARPDNSACFGPERGFDTLHQEGHLSLLEMAVQGSGPRKKKAAPPQARTSRSKSEKKNTKVKSGGRSTRSSYKRPYRQTFFPGSYYSHLKIQPSTDKKIQEKERFEKIFEFSKTYLYKTNEKQNGETISTLMEKDLEEETRWDWYWYMFVDLVREVASSDQNTPAFTKEKDTLDNDFKHHKFTFWPTMKRKLLSGQLDKILSKLKEIKGLRQNLVEKHCNENTEVIKQYFDESNNTPTSSVFGWERYRKRISERITKKK